MKAITEFVVPKSIPTALLIDMLLQPVVYSSANASSLPDPFQTRRGRLALERQDTVE
jgi:hypothetical protein